MKMLSQRHIITTCVPRHLTCGCHVIAKWTLHHCHAGTTSSERSTAGCHVSGQSTMSSGQWWHDYVVSKEYSLGLRIFQIGFRIFGSRLNSLFGEWLVGFDYLNIRDPNVCSIFWLEAFKLVLLLSGASFRLLEAVRVGWRLVASWGSVPDDRGGRDLC